MMLSSIWSVDIWPEEIYINLFFIKYLYMSFIKTTGNLLCEF